MKQDVDLPAERYTDSEGKHFLVLKCKTVPVAYLRYEGSWVYENSKTSKADEDTTAYMEDSYENTYEDSDANELKKKPSCIDSNIDLKKEANEIVNPKEEIIIMIETNKFMNESRIFHEEDVDSAPMSCLEGKQCPEKFPRAHYRSRGDWPLASLSSLFTDLLLSFSASLIHTLLDKK